jgi:hypothetical protein
LLAFFLVCLGAERFEGVELRLFYLLSFFLLLLLRLTLLDGKKKG